MMKCKQCGQKLSKLDKDICPFCGCKKPLEGMEDVTQDITKAFTLDEITNNDIKQKSKILALILSIFFGVIALPLFYLGKTKKALLQLAFNIVFICLIGCILFFTNLIPNAFAFLIPLFAIELLSIIYGLKLFFSNSCVDSRGEFLK